MPDQEKEREKEKDKDKAVAHGTPEEPTSAPISAPAGKSAGPTEEEVSQHFFGEPLVGFDPSEITGKLVVIEGMDGSGRSTQIALLQEWLESEGFAVQTSGLRRSNLVGRDIDQLLAKNAVTRLTLSLMYATDFFDQANGLVEVRLGGQGVELGDGGHILADVDADDFGALFREADGM